MGAMVDLSFEVDETDETTVLAVSGEVDAATAPQLRDQLDRLAGSGHAHVVVNLAEVDFIDSSALSALVVGLKRFENFGGEMVLCCAQPRILKVLEIAGLGRIMRVFDTLDDALAART